MDKQIDSIIYDPSEHIAVNKLKKLIDLVIHDEKMMTPKMKDSMLLVKKYIPSDHLMKTFEDYDKKFVEQIQYYNQKIKMLSNILKILSEKKGGAAKKRKSVQKKKRKSVQKKAKKPIQKKRKSGQKKAKKSVQKK